MKLDWNNPAHVKLGLLAEGVTFSPGALAQVGTVFAEKIRAYNDGNQPFTQGAKLPGELLLPDDLVVAAHFRPWSPWQVQPGKDGQFLLTRHEVPVCTVRLPGRPRYYGHTLAEGFTVDQLVSQYSAFVLGVFLNRQCHFWLAGQPCRFCSVEPVRRKDRQVQDQPQESLLPSAVRLAVTMEPCIRAMEWSGGVSADLDEGFGRAMATIRAVIPHLPRALRLHCNFMPPHDFSLLPQLEVVQEATFALEVWDPALFARICPGKARSYGREKFLEVFRAAANLFGPGKISCNFVAGLEPVESLLDGFEYLANLGIVPTAAIFHPDPGTPFANRPPPTVEYLCAMARGLGRIYRAKTFRPYLLGCRRSSLDSEIYLGYFED